jgi:hypothetical protein
MSSKYRLIIIVTPWTGKCDGLPPASLLTAKIAAASQHSLRSHGPQQQHRPATLLDELDRYLREPIEDPRSYDDDPIKWWRNIGTKRFPRLSFLASDLLSIPSSTAVVERQFSRTESIVTPKRNRLSRIIICQAQSLRFWRQQQTYWATEYWEQTLPL